MAVFNLDCPKCRTTLKSSKAVPAGTGITCPKCSHKFRAPAAKPKDVGFEVIDDEEDVVEVIDDEVEVIDDEPKKKPKPGKPLKARPKRKRAKNSGLITGAIIGGVLLVILGGLGIGLSIMLRPGPDTAIAYVPADSQVVGGINFDAIYSATSLGSDLDRLLDSIPPVAQWKTDSGMSYRELLSSIAFGLQEVSGQQKQALTVKSARPLDRPKLAKAIGGTGSPETVAGRTVYSIMLPDGTRLALVEATPTVTAITDSATIEYLPRTGRSAFAGDLNRLAAKAKDADLWFAANPSGPSRNQFLQGMQMGAGSDPDVSQALSSAKGMVLWGKISGGTVEFGTAFLCNDAAAAQRLNEVMAAAAKKQASNPLQGLGNLFLPAGVVALQKEMTDTTTYSTDGAMAISTARVSVATLESAIRDGVQFAQRMAPMMGGGFGGGGLGRGR